MRTLTIALLMILSLSSFGQLVDFKEKNSFYLGYRGALSFGLVNQVGSIPMFSPSERDGLNIHYNVHPRLDYIFALTNSLSLKAHASVGMTSRYKDHSGRAESFENNFSYQYETGKPRYVHSKVGLQINWFLYGKGSIAPVGSYIGLGFARRFTTGFHKDMTLATNSYLSNPVPDDVVDISNYQFAAVTNRINLQFGSREMITRKVFYDLCLDIGFNYQPVSEYLDYESNATTQENILDLLEERWYESHRFKDVATINVGIGCFIH